MLGDGVENNFVIPVGFTDEALQGTSRLSESIGDGLDIFPFEIGEESLDVHGGILSRFGAWQVCEKGCQKSVESLGCSCKVFLVDDGILLNFAFSRLKSLFHKDFREKEKRVILQNRQIRKDQFRILTGTVQLLNILTIFLLNINPMEKKPEIKHSK
jgi:hypothetical protein